MPNMLDFQFYGTAELALAPASIDSVGGESVSEHGKAFPGCQVASGVDGESVQLLLHIFKTEAIPLGHIHHHVRGNGVVE